MFASALLAACVVFMAGENMRYSCLGCLRGVCAFRFPAATQTAPPTLFVGDRVAIVETKDSPFQAPPPVYTTDEQYLAGERLRTPCSPKYVIS